MKARATFQRYVAVGVFSLALMTAIMPQGVFANADTNSIPAVPTTPAIASTTAAPTAQANFVTATVKPGTIVATSCTSAININLVSFKDFIKDMHLKSNVPAATLAQAEKHFKAFKAESKAKQDKKAMASFDKMMQLLIKYHDGTTLFLP